MTFDTALDGAHGGDPVQDLDRSELRQTLLCHKTSISD